MAESLESQLTALARGFSLSRLTPAAGANPRQVKLGLRVPRQALQRSDLIAYFPQALDPVLTTVTEPTNMNVDLGWRAKNVRFDSVDLAQTGVLGGMPIAEVLPASLTGVTVGSVTPPGVPGVLGLLQGTFQVPMQVTRMVEPEPILHELGLEVRITVTDEHGRRQPIGHSSFEDLAGFAEVPGDELVLTGADARSVVAGLNLVLGAVFVDLGTNVVLTVQRTIHVSVQLTAGGAVSERVSLPPLNVTIPAIGVPAMVVMFEHAGFTGRIFVALPSNSPIDPASTGAANVTTVLGTLTTALATLTPPGAPTPAAHPLIALLAPGGIGAMIPGLAPAAGTVLFVKADNVPSFDEHVFVTGVLGFGRVTAEDLVSSFIFIGAPGRRVQLIITRDFVQNEGAMEVTLGPELATSITSLVTTTPVSDMGANRVSVLQTPRGTKPIFRRIVNFNDELSSLRFGFA